MRSPATLSVTAASCLAISTAFAAALVGPCGEESGGIHLRGPSSIGKTTALVDGRLGLGRR